MIDLQNIKHDSLDVGNIVFLLLEKSFTIVPARVFSKIEKKMLDDETGNVVTDTDFIIEYYSKKDNELKKNEAALKKLKVPVFDSIKDAKLFLVRNALKNIDRILKTTAIRVEKFFKATIHEDERDIRIEEMMRILERDIHVENNQFIQEESTSDLESAPVHQELFEVPQPGEEVIVEMPDGTKAKLKT